MKSLHENIYEFAASQGMKAEDSDTNFMGGKVTTYHLIEEAKVYYELRHAKPREDIGSMVRIYSRATNLLTIKAKTVFFIHPTLKSNPELPVQTQKQLLALAKRIGSYQWISEPHRHEWPKELKDATVLRFECKRIDLAVQHLASIRQMHLNLLDSN